MKDGTAEGDCGGGLALYRWRETVSKTDTEGLHDVTVTIENARSGLVEFTIVRGKKRLVVPVRLAQRPAP